MRAYNFFLHHISHKLLLTIFLFLFFHQGSLFAEQKSDLVRVGIFQNKPLSFTDEQGTAQGIYPDIIREIAKSKNWNLEFVVDSWSGNLEKLKIGNIDLMISIVNSEERDKIFDFSKEPVVTLWGQVYTQKDSGIINILDLAGKNVAIMKKDINAINFIELCKKFNVKCNFVNAKKYDDVCELILSKKVDAGVINNINGEFLKRKYNIYSTPIMFSPVVPVFAVPENENHTLLLNIDSKLSEWQKDQHSIYYDILNTWFGGIRPGFIFPYKLIVTIILIAIGISLFLLTWMRILKTQVKNRTTQLREGEEKYRLLFNSANDAVFVHQPHKDSRLVKFLEVNDVAGRMYGYSKKELLELSPTDLAKPEREKEVRGQVKKLFADGYNIFEMVHKKKGGKEFPVEVSAYLFDFKNKPTILSIVRDITDRKKSEKKLHQEKEFTETALNSQQDTFFLFDPNTGKAIRWNKAFSKVSGYDDDEIAKMIAPNSYYNTEDLEKVPLFMDEVLETERGRIELELICKNGFKILTEYNVSVIKDKHGSPKYIIFIGRDITERKQAEDSLKSSQERFLTVLNSIDATVYVVDIETYEILFMNEYMMKSFGRDMTGETCWESYREESGPCVHCPNKKLVDEQGKSTGVVVWQTKNPVTDKWYINYDRAIEWTDGRLVKIQIATDITQLKKMEEELRQSHKMESIGTLAGGIAHDFNNILGIIIGNAELALDDISDWNPSFKNIMEIKTASLRAKNVVQQLLSFSRKTEQKQKPLDIPMVIDESLNLIKSSVPSNIEIRKDIPKKCNAILADATQIHQVLINLCTNAAHAIGEDGGVLAVGLRTFVLEKKSEEFYKELPPGEYLELTIMDNGSGIDPQTCEKIFDPYFTTKEVGKGTGMGLSVVHGIVKNHKGEIYVKSEPGKGTTFTILFPTVAEHPELKTKDVFAKPYPTGKETLLFVDDEVALVDMAKLILEKLGYTVQVSTNPVKALNLFKVDPNQYNLVISDMTMPQMSGIKLSENIKKIRNDIPIIICTGHSSLMDEEKAKNIGISAFVMKPITMSEIAKLIRKVLDKSSLRFKKIRS